MFDAPPTSYITSAETIALNYDKLEVFDVFRPGVSQSLEGTGYLNSAAGTNNGKSRSYDLF